MQVERRHPKLAGSVSSRIAALTLTQLVLAYILTTVVLAAVLALPSSTALVSTSYGVRWLLAFDALWSGGGSALASSRALDLGLFVALGLKLLGVLLPVLLLGAFVFRLFKRDPLVWRNRVSYLPPRLGADSGRLLVRYYNKDWSPLVAVSVRAYARFSLDNGNTTHLRALQCEVAPDLLDGPVKHGPENFWASCSQGMPFTSRVDLAGDLLEVNAVGVERPVGDLKRALYRLPTISGYRDYTCADVRIFLLATGTIGQTGVAFTSSKTYDLADAEVVAYGSVEVVADKDAVDWKGWTAFDGAELEARVNTKASGMQRAWRRARHRIGLPWEG